MPARKARSETFSEMGKRRLAARKEGSIHYQEQRRALHNAAASLFKEKGYKETSLDDIAKAAGFDRSSLYYYTSSKKQLFFDIVLDAMNSVVEVIRGIAAEKAAPRKKIENLVSAMMENYEKSYPYMYVFARASYRSVRRGHSSTEEGYGLDTRSR